MTAHANAAPNTALQTDDRRPVAFSLLQSDSPPLASNHQA